MESYTATKSPDPDTWLELDESIRLSLIRDYVEEHETELPPEAIDVHASVHMIVENQLALNTEDTVNAYHRLIRQGLSRHNTIHAIGSVVIEELYNQLQDDHPKKSYKNRLRKLSAQKWLKGKY